MADQKQPTADKKTFEREPLTGLNLTSDATTTSDTYEKSTALAEVDPNSVSHGNSNTSISATSKPAADPKKMSITEPNEDASGVDDNIEVVLPEGEDHEDGLDDDVGGSNMQMEVGEKKKKSKKKKKPKSKRGLVGSKSIIRIIFANAFLARRTIRQDSRSITLILPSRQPSMMKRRASTTCEYF